MRRLLACLLVGGFAAGSFATDSRIIALGRHDNFFMDDYSIFRNPANVSIFPNMLMGSPGEFRALINRDTSAIGKMGSGLQRTNRDAQRPYAGGILSYSFNKSSEAGSQYPMFSFAPVLNRYDEWLDYVIPGTPKFNDAFENFAATGDTALDHIYVPRPAGKIDLLLGYAFKNGGMIGVGGYIAQQKDFLPSGDEDSALEASLYKGSVGINWPLAKTTDIEASLDIGSAKCVARSGGTAVGLTGDLDERALMIKGDARVFTALSVLNGDLVPHLGVDYINMERYTLTRVAAGLGININVDKGFGWAGLEFLTEQKNRGSYGQDSRGFGGRLSFGFERNLLWDWFLFRAGVSKRLLYVTDPDGNQGRLEENAEGDASDDDFLGCGIGFNVENRLKIDMVLAEDFFYTFSNLISSPQDHLFTRFSITYSF